MPTTRMTHNLNEVPAMPVVSWKNTARKLGARAIGLRDELQNFEAAPSPYRLARAIAAAIYADDGLMGGKRTAMETMLAEMREGLAMQGLD